MAPSGRRPGGPVISRMIMIRDTNWFYCCMVSSNDLFKMVSRFFLVKMCPLDWRTSYPEIVPSLRISPRPFNRGPTQQTASLFRALERKAFFTDTPTPQRESLVPEHQLSRYHAQKLCPREGVVQGGMYECRMLDEMASQASRSISRHTSIDMRASLHLSFEIRTAVKRNNYEVKALTCPHTQTITFFQKPLQQPH